MANNIVKSAEEAVQSELRAIAEARLLQLIQRCPENSPRT